jgi:hypothetical protein
MDISASIAGRTYVKMVDAALPLSKATINSEGLLIQVSCAGASRLYTLIIRITALTEVVHNVRIVVKPLKNIEVGESIASYVIKNHN